MYTDESFSTLIVSFNKVLYIVVYIIKCTQGNQRGRFSCRVCHEQKSMSRRLRELECVTHLTVHQQDILTTMLPTIK